MSPSRSLQVAPARGVELRQAARLLQPIDDALPHLGGGLAREGDREDVLGLDAGAQQVDVALDQHARLAGAGRRLEHDVLGEGSTAWSRAAVGQSRESGWIRFDSLALLRQVSNESDRRILAPSNGSLHGRRGSAGLLDIADVILAADRREAARLAAIHVVGRRRELAALDAHRRCRPGAAARRRAPSPIGRSRREQRHDALAVPLNARYAASPSVQRRPSCPSSRCSAQRP